jgi:acyl-homoserine lactone acylase PvdQ
MIISDDTTLFNHESFPFNNWISLLAEALDNAAAFLVRTLGENIRIWHWGDLHVIEFRHGGGPRFRANGTVTYRQIIDLSDVNKSFFIVPPGQSRHVASLHYSDMLNGQFNGTYRPLLWNWDDIATTSEAQQPLMPSQQNKV